MNNEAAVDFLLAFADDEHLMGQQHTEWIGVAPFLEEDLALSSIGQDELGHAAMLYERVLALQGVETGDPKTLDHQIDQLALRRNADDYRCSAFVEFPTEDWGQALVRHWIYDTVELQRWRLLEESSDEALRAIATSALREERYHLLHADALLDPLLADPHGRDRLVNALETIVPLVSSLLEPAAGEAEAQSTGLVTGSLAECTDQIQDAISQRFARPVSLHTPAVGASGRNRRSIYFEPLIGRMREVLDYDPKAVW